MKKNIRWPIQSLLFIPANRDDFISKASRYEPDAVILDLEDALPKSQLPAARLRIKEQIQLLSTNQIKVFVRINSMSEGGLDDFAARGVAVVEKLAVAFFADAEAVGAAAEFFTEGADEFALGIVNDDGLGAHRRGVDGVGDVDEALAVLGQTVGVAPDEALWLGQPVVDHLVSVRAGAGDQGSRAGLRLGADEGGGD